MSDSNITPKFISILKEVTKSIYPLIPSLKKFVFTVRGNNSYELQNLAEGSTERISGTFGKGDEYKKLKDFASVAALISPQDYGKRFLYEIREDKTFRFYLLDSGDNPQENPEIYPLDFRESGDGVPPECGIYIATASDGIQTFAAYIIKERYKEKRGILAVSSLLSQDTEEAETYAAAQIPGGSIMNVFRYSMKDTYRSKKQTALLDKAMRMLEKAGLCEPCERNTKKKEK